MTILINCDSANEIIIRESSRRVNYLLREKEDYFELQEQNISRLYNKIRKKMWINAKYRVVPQEKEQFSVNRKLNLECCNIYWIVKRLLKNVFEFITKKMNNQMVLI